MRVSDYIFEKLSSIGVTKAYLVTGRGVLFLTDGLARNSSILPICTHHEQAAGYAAVAEAQFSGKPSLCVVSTGCASTNCITPLLNAWQDGLPVIFISGQNTLKETTYFSESKVRTFGQQEANIIEIVKSITKYSTMITCAQEVPNILEEAIHLASTGRKGPVWIDIPLDIQSARIDESNLFPSYKPKKFKKNNSNLAKSIDRLVHDLKKSTRPIALIGSGVRSSNTQVQLSDFITKNKIPLVYSSSSVDIYPSGNTLSIGSIGSMGCSRQGAFALQNSDLILVLGNRLPSILTGIDCCKFGREASIHIVDIDLNEHQKEGIKADNFINTDLSVFFESLPKEKITENMRTWNKQVHHWKNLFKDLQNFGKSKHVDLYELCDSLSQKMSKDSILLTDSGFIEVILPTNIDFYPKRRSIHPVSQGSMGFALPAILGVHSINNKKQEIIAVIGDGSIMMNIQELQTIKHHKVNVKIIIINNNIYSIIRRRQKELFRKRTIGTGIEDGISVPNFKKIASTFSFDYIKCRSSKTLSESLDKLLSSNNPTILEIYGRHDQEYIEISHTKSLTGKFVRRPLEDQWPFLDRDVFLKEMIIDPIDQ
jgi:acetolactate synthase I/II/III large subunit